VLQAKQRFLLDNEFHNFEHATHVLMSVLKLLGRVTSTSEVAGRASGDASKAHNSQQTCFLDPFIQFGCVFSAPIHDVDHQGVSNMQLVKEANPLATRYEGQAVAEQSAIDIGWAEFMSEEYSEFRAAICPSDYDVRRLRQIVVNSVIATDIVDSDLKERRNERWDKAFAEEFSPCEERSDSHEIINRRATLVLEHLIQASDVSHCMQHWQVYRKWNERLFREMNEAYMQGRAARDPAEFWYQGELCFFTFYVIPLAKKLRDCQVFGVSSDEFLNYAEQNREEWERRGQDIVEKMANRARRRSF
jgi:3'5'-cyclic nucleotide phosphodiesterase